MMRMSGHIVYVNKEWYHGDIFFFVSFMLLGIKEIFLYPFLPKFDPFNFIIHVRTVRNEQNLYDSYRLLKRGFQRDNIPLAESRDSVSGGEWGKAPHKAFKCSAKGEFQNSPKDYFERGNALQERVPLLPQTFQQTDKIYIILTLCEQVLRKQKTKRFRR